MKGIIIEGVATAGKTLILKHIQEEIVKEKFSSTKFFISEHYTQRMLEHLVESNDLTGKTVKKHIEGIIKNLEKFEEMLNGSKFASEHNNAESFVTLERFILTYLSSTPQLAEEYKMPIIKNHFLRLKKLNVKQYILTLSDDQITKNIESTLKYRNDVWRKYVEQNGGANAVANKYIKWQNDILKLASELDNSIEVEIINVDDKKYKVLAEMIYKTNFI